MTCKNIMSNSASDKATENNVALPTRDPQAISLPAKLAGDWPKHAAQAATRPSFNAALVVQAFQSNITGKDVDLLELMVQIQTNFQAVENGNLTTMEAMLVAQATALQTIFTNLAKRASVAEQAKHFQVFMSLALKAQAQSRATISALVDLKYPKQAATFVKQANISSGHQQVNNGAVAVPCVETHAGAGNLQTTPNKLLEGNHGQRLDFGAQAEASANHQ
jgi:hypothetical protein